MEKQRVANTAVTGAGAPELENDYKDSAVVGEQSLDDMVSPQPSRNCMYDSISSSLLPVDSLLCISPRL